MSEHSTVSPSLRSLLLIAGICSFLAMAANFLDVLLSVGDSEVAAYGTKSAREWIRLFQLSWFKGVYTLGILNMVYMTCMLPVYLGTYALHRSTHPFASLFAILLAALALGIYMATNAAIPMYVLSTKYTAAATEVERQSLVVAAEAVLARGEDFTPGSFLGLLTSGIAALTLAFIMLRGRHFSKSNALVGLIGFTLLTLFTTVATFISAWYTFAFSYFGRIGGVLALAWFVMTGVRFIKLSRAAA